MNQLSTNNRMSRLASVDIAKSIAVISVFLYHLPSVSLKSGFLGVDLFLLVTGYLSAATLSKIEPIEFFIKRLARIWPSLILLLLVVVLVFQYFMYFSELKNLYRDSVISNLFLSNFGLFYLSKGYFDQGTQFSPLFHLWSISLEVQLWLLLALIVFVFKARKNLIIIIASILSLIFTIYIFYKNQDVNIFYLFPFSRFWEAGIGYLVYQYRVRTNIHIIGIYLIVVLLFIIMSLDVIRHQYLWFIFVFLSVLVLTSDIVLGSRSDAVVRYFSTRTYGVYLVHVPLIVLCSVFLQLSIFITTSLTLIGTLFYAEFSYRFLEK